MRFDCVLVFLLLSPSAVSALTQSEYEAVYKRTMRHLGKNKFRGILPSLVRLEFHDCVQGCDGCLNLINPANIGLAKAVDAMARIRATAVTKDGVRPDILTTADTWAIGAKAAIDVAIENANSGCPLTDKYCKVPPMSGPFRWGRQDCPGSPHFLGLKQFPDPIDHATEMFEFFDQTSGLGFTPQEVAALVGVHTLGRMHLVNSGYRGVWVDEEGIYDMDNEFYKVLFDEALTWKKYVTPVNKLQLNSLSDEARGVLSMLNSDFALLFEDALGSCLDESDVLDRDNCEKAITYDLAKMYAENVTKWMEDFSPLFWRMTSTGYSQLRPLE